MQYHLFTRNQSGSDYGWTGFNWNYTVAAAAGSLTPIGAKAMWLDTNTIAWNGVAGIELQAALRSRRRDDDRGRGDGCAASPSPAAALLRDPHRQRHGQRLPQEPQRHRQDAAA